MMYIRLNQGSLKGFSVIGLLSTVFWVSAPVLATPSHQATPSAPLAESALKDAIASPIFLAQSNRDIVDTALTNGSFQTLIRLLNELGMAEDLRGYGRFTVFAPTDAAFAAVPPAIMEKLSGDRELMAKVLAYHVVAGRTPLLARDIDTPVSLTTLERSDIRLTRRSGTLYVNDARVTTRDIEASNGVIHAIDKVLIPDDVLAQLR
jgi:uncharacterized surface protein with fasciclin (FAS1) repeats